MKCPNDDITLIMSERSGIEIDYCPECRGVWLDRGELDKIIERSATEQAPSRAQPPAPAQSYERSYEQERDERRVQQDHRYAQAGQQPYRKKKESWLSEIFD
jgi:Zn-finger nucleic acid-binding protein